MSKLTIALCACAFAFGPASAQADDSDKNPPEEKAAAKSEPAAKKDWPTKREKQEAAAAAARERAERAEPKERPLVSDFGPPSVNASDPSKVKPKPSPAEKEREKREEGEGEGEGEGEEVDAKRLCLGAGTRPSADREAMSFEDLVRWPTRRIRPLFSCPRSLPAFRRRSSMRSPKRATSPSAANSERRCAKS